MPIDDRLRTLAARIGAFHITDRAMKRAQSVMEHSLRSGDVAEETCVAYLAAAQRYFEEFANEARANLRDVDQRLEQANQVTFNLTAERGVAVKRIEATQSVLQGIGALRESP